MTDTTPNLTLPYIMAAQAQKHVTHNEAIRMLDALVQLAVADRDLAMRPSAPPDGARYIVAAGAGGGWAGQSGRIAAWQDGAWAFLTPREGWVAWVADEDRLYAFDGTAWATISSGGTASVNPTPLVGVNATADTTNRLSVASPASLFNHEGAGHQLKVNKAAASSTASLLLQDAFSGRAEVGLAGDDDLHFKVSADGSTWRDALIVDRATGAVSMPFTSPGGSGGSNSTADGRLTLSPGAPITTASVAAATTLYYTPCIGNGIQLYDGAVWAAITFAETSISLAGTSGNTNYDVFGYDNSGTLALELAAWTSDTVRATAVVRQNGVLVKSGAPTRRLLGTIRINTAGQCNWVPGSLAAGGGAGILGVSNVQNRRLVTSVVRDSTDTWTYAPGTPTWHAANNDSATARTSFVNCIDDDAVMAQYSGFCAHSAGGISGCGVGLDTTTTFSGTAAFNTSAQLTLIPAGYVGRPGVGWHFLSANEVSSGPTSTFAGDIGVPTLAQSGLVTTLMM